MTEFPVYQPLGGVYYSYLSQFAVMASSKDWHLIFFAEKTYDQIS